MIATCGQWFSAAYRNSCLACEQTGKRKELVCRCCGGSGFHSAAKPTGSHPFTTPWFDHR